MVSMNNTFREIVVMVMLMVMMAIAVMVFIWNELKVEKKKSG